VRPLDIDRTSSNLVDCATPAAFADGVRFRNLSYNPKSARLGLHLCETEDVWRRKRDADLQQAQQRKRYDNAPNILELQGNGLALEKAK